MTVASVSIAVPALLAQTQQPIRIITGEPAKPGIDWPPIIGMLAGTAVLIALCMIIAVYARRRLRARAPEESALLALAKRMRLRRAELSLLRDLALTAGIQAPVAVLISRGAFEQVMQAAVGRGAPAENVRRVRSLGQRMRWFKEGDPEPDLAPAGPAATTAVKQPATPPAKKKGKPDAGVAARLPAPKARAAPTAPAPPKTASKPRPDPLAALDPRIRPPSAPSVAGRNGRPSRER